MKTFLITVDTEGDNLWQWKPGEKITTENSLFIPRFQELCEKYGLIPTYLTKIYVREHTFIGTGVIIMPGVTIGKRCVIGAGAVVTRDIPDNSVAVGVPAKVISTTEQYAEKCL